MSGVFLGLMIWGIVALVLLGWLAPLIVGAVRSRNGKGGKVLIGVGAVWCLLALGLVGLAVKAYTDWNRSYNHEVAAFDASSYTGAVGTLTFPYAYQGKFEFRQEGPDGDTWWKVAVSNGTAVVPAGRLSADNLSFSVTDSQGKALGTLNCGFSPEHESFSLATNGQHRLAGGFPWVAAVQVEKLDDKLSMSFSMMDSAENTVAWYAAGADRKPPAFEAVDSSGKCFWRDNFEYG